MQSRAGDVVRSAARHPGRWSMGYTRRRAVLCEIERLCAAALSEYSDCVSALQAGDAHRFRHSLQLLFATAGQLERLAWTDETAEWLGISASPALHRARGRPEAGSFDGIPLPHCAWFLESSELPAWLAAVAEVGQLAEARLAELRLIV